MAMRGIGDFLRIAAKLEPANASIVFRHRQTVFTRSAFPAKTPQILKRARGSP